MAFDHERVSSLRWGRSGNADTLHLPPDRRRSGGRGRNRQRRQRKRPRSALRQARRVRRRPGLHRAGRCGHAHHPHREPTGPPGAAGEPPFYETRYNYDNADGLLTRIVRPDGSTVEKQFEIDLRPDAIADRARQPAHRSATPRARRAATAGVGAPLRVSARLRLHLRAGVRHPGDRSARRRAVDRVRRPRKPGRGRRPGRQPNEAVLQRLR